MDYVYENCLVEFWWWKPVCFKYAKAYLFVGTNNALIGDGLHSPR
jgi:hypothetical protein